MVTLARVQVPKIAQNVCKVGMILSMGSATDRQRLSKEWFCLVIISEGGVDVCQVFQVNSQQRIISREMLATEAAQLDRDRKSFFVAALFIEFDYLCIKSTDLLTRHCHEC